MSLCKKKSKEQSLTCSGNEQFQRCTSTPQSSICSQERKCDLSFHLNILPIIPSRPEKYKPMPYAFRVPNLTQYSTIKNGLIKCPPFYLQLDHTIAVLWSLFSKSDVPKEIGIVQLQWTLGFLRNVHNIHGEYTKDVQICIRAIENQLLELYADMVNEVKKIPPRKRSCGSCCKKTSSSTGTIVNEIQTFKQNYVRKQVPFSINYAEMIKRNTDLKQTKTKFCATGSASTCRSSSKSSAASIKPQETTQMVQFLNSWRSEQVQKIEAELKRLHSIENFISNANKNNFQPYLEGNSLNVLATCKTCSTNTSNTGEKKSYVGKACRANRSKESNK